MLPIKEIVIVSALSVIVVQQGNNLLKKIGGRLSRLFFTQINIPVENNKILFSKIQTFLKTNAICYGSSETVVENGNDRYITGHIITRNPLSFVSVRPDQIKVWLYYRSTEYFLKYLDQFKHSDNTIRLYTLATPNDNWQKVKTLARANIPLLYTEETVNRLEENINCFLNSKKQYQLLGKTHKTTLLFYGPPGTGKTFCVKWLAMKYGRDVYTIDPSHYFNDRVDVYQTVANISQCQGGILLFEDIDRYFATLYAKQQCPNISKFLNFLDGLYTPDNIIIILTANYEGDIPESIKRDGRIDLTIHMQFVNSEILEKICQLYKVSSSLINIIGNVTTSEVVKKIDQNQNQLKEGVSITIQGGKDTDESYSNHFNNIDSISVISS